MCSPRDCAACHLLPACQQIFKDVHGRLHKVRKASEQADVVNNALPQSTQLQLGLTTLALLQLQPQYAYGSSASIPADLEQFRAELLELLDTNGCMVRMRAGPLVAQLIADAAAAALKAAAAAAPAQPAAAPDTGGSTVSAAVLAAVADMQQRLILQQSSRLDQQQAALQGLLKKHHMSPEEEANKKEGLRQMKLRQLYWDTAMVQITDLASVAGAVAAAAVQQEELPDALDAQLLQLLCAHTAAVQQLPSDLLPSLCSGAPDGKSGALQLATAALDVMAVQQQYSNRFAYLAYHAPAWLWVWFLTGHSFEELLLLCPLLCTPAAAVGNRNKQYTGAAMQRVKAELGSSRKAAQQLLQQYGGSIVTSLLHTSIDDEGQHSAHLQQQLDAMAEAAGVPLEALYSEWRWVVYGTLYPMITTRTGPVAKRATEVAERLGNRDTVRAVGDTTSSIDAGPACSPCVCQAASSTRFEMLSGALLNAVDLKQVAALTACNRILLCTVTPWLFDDPHQYVAVISHNTKLREGKLHGTGP